MNVGTGNGIFMLASGHLSLRVHHREVRHKVQDLVFLKLLKQNVDMCIFELEVISDAPLWVHHTKQNTEGNRFLTELSNLPVKKS